MPSVPPFAFPILALAMGHTEHTVFKLFPYDLALAGRSYYKEEQTSYEMRPGTEFFESEDLMFSFFIFCPIILLKNS